MPEKVIRVFNSISDFAHRTVNVNINRKYHNFLEHISGKRSNRFKLSDRSGRSWDVDLCKTKLGTFIQTGWPEFVKGHNLKEYDFLLFEYDGNVNFNVFIYDTTSCEKEDQFQSESSQVHHSMMENKTEIKKLDPNYMLLIKKIQGLCTCRLGDTAVLSDKTHDCSKEKVNDYHVPCCPPGFEYQCITREVLNSEEAAPSLHSMFPRFVYHLPASSVEKPFIMNIPKGFADDHLPMSKGKCTLRVAEGRFGKVEYMPNLTGVIFSGGWETFARENPTAGR